MQDIHSIGGGGGGDRRMRPHHHQNHQSLKCPRCDSLNTKFCYYNNYNLSQPRHFCKNCRRYWTKGGVLRNVPVGGGCRKTKRSKPKTSSATATAAATATADAPRDRKSNSHSSSESSSLTASTTAAPPSTVEVASASSSTSASTLLNFPDSRFFNSIPQATNPSFRHHHHPPLIDQSSSDGGIFPEIGGSFTSLMTSSNDSSSILGFNIADISASAYRLHQQNQGPVVQNQNSNQIWQEQQEKMGCSVPNELKMQQISAGFLDQTAEVDLSGMQNRENSGGLGGLDWQVGGDQGLFDFTGTVDQAYWSQTQWNDSDHHLYLP
ncbi:hypothetical protein CsSME_00006637 [Camellia sinensis var. sinensis]